MELIAEARTRTVYDRGDGYVVKVATCDEGEIANLRERHWANTPGAVIPVAPCWLEWPDDDTPAVLVMEKVVRFPTVEEYATLPDWCGYVDCQQVGWLTDGRLVAYDL